MKFFGLRLGKPKDIHGRSVIASGKCGESLTWTLNDEGTLTICGTGTIRKEPWNKYDYIKSVVLENGVTGIGEEAFAGCSNLTSITIPDSVTEIGRGAFSHCRNLTSVTIPNSVTKIGVRAFEYCLKLTNVAIPNSVAEIEFNAFGHCTSLTNITIPDSVTKIGRDAFADCSSLTSVTIPNSVTEIGYGAFADCSALTNIAIPDSVTKIDTSAFLRCTSLTDITIPDSVIKVGNYAFFDIAENAVIHVSDPTLLIDGINLNVGRAEWLNFDAHEPHWKSFVGYTWGKNEEDYIIIKAYENGKFKIEDHLFPDHFSEYEIAPDSLALIANKCDFNTEFKLKYLDVNHIMPVLNDVPQQEVVGVASWEATGEVYIYTDLQEFVELMRKELEYRNTSGFSFFSLSTSPIANKTIDDTLYAFYGEPNPHSMSYYEEDAARTARMNDLGYEKAYIYEKGKVMWKKTSTGEIFKLDEGEELMCSEKNIAEQEVATDEQIKAAAMQMIQQSTGPDLKSEFEL